MAIRVSFGGRSIAKPGAYSRFRVDNSSGSPLGSNDSLFLIGESSKGAPGSETGILSFTAEQLPDMIALYGSGPLVDAAIAAVRPSVSPGVSGAGRILVWKTNASTQASATVETSAPADLFTVSDRAYGADGNNLSLIIADGTAPATQKLISVSQLGGTTENLGENAGEDILSIQYTGDASTAELEITGVTQLGKQLTVTLAGDQTDGSVDQSINLNGRTMKQLVDLLNAQVGYTATLLSVPRSQTSATQLDPVAGGTDVTSAVTLRRLQNEILDLLNESDRISATLEDTPVIGLPANTAGLALSGGAQGASANQDFSTGFDQSLGVEYNVALPCISRDAATDILDAKLGFTDAASTYTISSVLAALGAHLSLRGDVVNRKEAQGMGGIRNTSKAALYTQVAALADFNLQVAIQDTVFIDATGSSKVGQPHIFAAQCAGIRLGTDVGEPLTHKFLRTQLVGHVLDPDTLLEDGDFNPGTDFNPAIDAGILFAENRNGGYRIVVDNTTYGLDQSFVFNRGSVIEASYFVFRTLRETAETLFVGQKVSNGLAQSIKEAVRNKLRELNQPDVQIITSSDDAPEGFREDTFVVTVSGNTARVQVEFKPVQGLDFVLFDFTLGDIQQSA